MDNVGSKLSLCLLVGGRRAGQEQMEGAPGAELCVLTSALQSSEWEQPLTSPRSGHGKCFAPWSSYLGKGVILRAASSSEGSTSSACRGRCLQGWVPGGLQWVCQRQAFCKGREQCSCVGRFLKGSSCAPRQNQGGGSPSDRNQRADIR